MVREGREDRVGRCKPDTKIMRRRDELAAYRRAGVHMFYLPGEAKVAVLVELVSVNLAEICTATSSRNPKLWYLTPEGLKELTPPVSPEV